jgi:hypothetical protein
MSGKGLALLPGFYYARISIPKRETWAVDRARISSFTHP